MFIILYLWKPKFYLKSWNGNKIKMSKKMNGNGCKRCACRVWYVVEESQTCARDNVIFSKTAFQTAVLRLSKPKIRISWEN